MDEKYNYFRDVNPNFESSEFDFEKRKDPDSHSKQLYIDLNESFFSDAERNKEYGIKNVKVLERGSPDGFYYTLSVNKDEYLLSTDYIGPSINYDGNQTDIVRKARILGGHIVWSRSSCRSDNERRWVTLYYKYKAPNRKPKYYNNEFLNCEEIKHYKSNKIQEDKLSGGNWNKVNITINTSRGGEFGLYDKIDCTLILLSIYYRLVEKNGRNRPCKESFISECKELYTKQKDYNWVEKIRMQNMYRGFDNSYEWLKQFNNFQNFSDFFLLKYSFVDQNYNVIYFDDEPFPVKKPNPNFMNNNIKAVQKRNVLIFDSVNRGN